MTPRGYTMPTPKIEALLAALTEEEKREVVLALIPGLFKKFRKPRVILDENRQYLGEYIPGVPAGPPKPLSAAERAALAGTKRKSRKEWEQELMATRQS